MFKLIRDLSNLLETVRERYDGLVSPVRDKRDRLIAAIRDYLLTVEKRVNQYNGRWPRFGALCFVVGVLGAGFVIYSTISDYAEAKRLRRASEEKRAAQSAYQFRWHKPETLLASTPKRRIEAARQLNIAEGEYLVALLSIHCDACDREALKLNQLSDTQKVIAIIDAPAHEREEWIKRLGLSYRVESVSADTFEDLGGVILPTLVKMENGQAIGVANSLVAVGDDGGAL